MAENSVWGGLMFKGGPVNVAASYLVTFMIVAVVWYVADAANISWVPAFPTLAVSGSSGATNTGLTPQNVPTVGTIPAGGSCGFGSILSVAPLDANTGSAVTAVTTRYFSNPATGTFALAGGNVSLGQNISVLTTETNYFSGFAATTVLACNPSIGLQVKGVDNPTRTVYNSFLGGTVNNATFNLTLNNGSSATAIVNLQQAAIYKHIAGPTNQFVVYLNASTASNWNPSTMSVSFKGTPCVSMNQYNSQNPTAIIQSQQPASVAGSIIYAAVCNGDFNPIDGGASNQLGIVLSAAPGVTVSHQAVGVNFVGADYYVNTQNNMVQLGAVTDTGGAIQTMRSNEVWVN